MNFISRYNKDLQSAVQTHTIVYISKADVFVGNQVLYTKIIEKSLLLILKNSIHRKCLYSLFKLQVRPFHSAQTGQ